MDIGVTDEYIKSNLIYIELESKDFKSPEFENGVYTTTINLKIMNEDEEINTLASARFFIANGEVVDIVDAADSESGDLYFVAETMINDFKISQDSTIAILDEYNLYSSKATVLSKKLLFQKYILPYFQDRRIDYIAFCNAAFEFTNNYTHQEFLDGLLDDMAILNSKETVNNDWKSIVNLIDISYATELENNSYLEEISENRINKSANVALEIDPFLEEYKLETGKNLPNDFEDQYNKYIFNDNKYLRDSVKECIINVYKFKKNIYYSEDGRRINITNEDRKEMNVFQNIRKSFENIEVLYDRVTSSYKNLSNEFIAKNIATNPNMTVGAFIAEGNMFIDYLEKKWLINYVPEFKDSWKNTCTYIYDNNLGYRLCYNLRNFDQHPQNHAAIQIISEVIEEIDSNRFTYYLNIPGFYKDRQIRRKMEKDLSYLQENGNNEFSEYARNYMINITLLYNLVLTQFFNKNLEEIKNVYSYLYQHDFSKTIIKSVDDRNKKIIGTSYADDIVTTLDIDTFLHCFESKGIINDQSILDIRNGNPDTYNSHLTPTQILENVIMTRFPQRNNKII